MNFTKNLALVLINTQKEYLSGDTHHCLDNYFRNTPSIDQKIDLYIFFNQGEESEYSNLLEYKQHKNVNNVIIKSHQLSDFDDLYARTPKELKEMNLPKVPPLGGSAGPNNLFFNSMIPLTEKSYRDYLMIEPDTKPIQDNWIDKIIQFCDDEKFLVAGSLYRGKATLHTFAHWSGHLNGVAIYRNARMLKILFKYAKALIEKETELTGNTFLSFDVAMHQLRCTLSGQKHFNNRNLPENHLIDCPIISNYSLTQDSDTTIKNVKKEHPQTIILHKKQSINSEQSSTAINHTKVLSIVYACTKAEFDSGELEKSIERYISHKPSKNYSFDLFVIVDQGDEEHYASILDFESDKNINKIIIHSLHISDKENIYIRSKHSLKKFQNMGEPSLGLSSGPNNLFFGAMNYLSNKDYENYLLLETDTRPVKYFWFDFLMKHSKNNFLIAGSSYKGNFKIPKEALWAKHLNGVAIYKNSPKLHNLLKESKQLIADKVKNLEDNCMINYDIAIFYSAQNNNLDSHLIDTDFITNISLSQDIKIKEQEILSKYENTVVLHQKIYKPIKKFTLLTTLYYDQSKERRKELAHCLEKNIKNKHIEDIIILTEVQNDNGFGAEIDSLIIDYGIEIVRVKKRPTYFAFFDYANDNLHGKKIIVANADIYFDDSLGLAYENHGKKDFYALTRWTITDDGNSYLPHVFNSSFPIDKINHEDMVGLRWWSPGMHPDGKWISKSEPVDSKHGKLTGETWAQDSGTFNQVYDYESKQESANSPGINKLTGEAIIWRNEHSADAWIFEAPFDCDSKNYKIPLGTFRCDTYLNYYLINAHLSGKINASNPCLSVKSFHYDYLRSEEDKNYVEDKVAKDGEDKFVDNYEFSLQYDKDVSEDPDQVLHRCFIPWRTL